MNSLIKKQREMNTDGGGPRTGTVSCVPLLSVFKFGTQDSTCPVFLPCPCLFCAVFSPIRIPR